MSAPWGVKKTAEKRSPLALSKVEGRQTEKENKKERRPWANSRIGY